MTDRPCDRWPQFCSAVVGSMVEATLRTAEHRNPPAVRSLLDERFRQLLGRSPIRYLTDWRLHVAEELLATTDLGVFAVARRVGYDAEPGVQACLRHGTDATGAPAEVADGPPARR